jgi:hypothetical protein
LIEQLFTIVSFDVLRVVCNRTSWRNPKINFELHLSPPQIWSYLFIYLFIYLFSELFFWDFSFIGFEWDLGQISLKILVLGHVWARLGWSSKKSFTWAPRIWSSSNFSLF